MSFCFQVFGVHFTDRPTVTGAVADAQENWLVFVFRVPLAEEVRAWQALLLAIALPAIDGRRLQVAALKGRG